MKLYAMDTHTFFLIGCALLVTSLLADIFLVVSIFRRRNLLSSWLRATARIVDVTFEAITPGNVHYYPVLEFTNATGTVIRFKSRVGTYPQKPVIGTALNIIYNPQDANDAIILSFSHLWLTQIVLGGLSAIATVLGIIFIVLSSR